MAEVGGGPSDSSSNEKVRAYKLTQTDRWRQTERQTGGDRQVDGFVNRYELMRHNMTLHSVNLLSFICVYVAPDGAEGSSP